MDALQIVGSGDADPHRKPGALPFRLNVKHHIR